MSTTLIIDRTLLGLGDLVITGSRWTTASGMWLAAEGFQLPRFTSRYRNAPPSSEFDGTVQLAYAIDSATVPLIVNLQAVSAAALDAKRAELTAALGQFTFPLSVDYEGVAYSWPARHSLPDWGAEPQWMRDDNRARANYGVPVNPT